MILIKVSSKICTSQPGSYAEEEISEDLSQKIRDLIHVEINSDEESMTTTLGRDSPLTVTSVSDYSPYRSTSTKRSQAIKQRLSLPQKVKALNTSESTRRKDKTTKYQAV